MLAVVDADYNFVYLDVGNVGRNSDGGVFANSSLSHLLEAEQLFIPNNKPLPCRRIPMPHVLVGDAAFPLKTYIIKPYPGSLTGQREKEIFNYRLSRARRIVENAFGILSNRFQVYLRPMQLQVETVKKIVLATCALHNFLRQTSSRQAYCPPGMMDMENTDGSVTDGSWRSSQPPAGLIPLSRRPSTHSTAAKDVRDEFCCFFNNEGAVPWQDRFA